jgi:hypothetical protein
VSRFTNREETQHHLQVCLQLKSHISKKFSVPVHREWYIILDHEDKFADVPQFEITNAQKARKNRYRNPDLIWFKNGLWILEVDGYVHHIKSEKTSDRNKIYHNNNCKFLTVETYEIVGSTVKNKPIEKIIKEFDEKITIYE